MKALVTGGGGFLGGAIVRALHKRVINVRTFQRGKTPHLNKLGVEVYRGDLGDKNAVFRAVSGCDLVFHVGAKTGVWGDYEDYYQTNVRGSQHIVEACRAHGVGKLIYTSSPSVVFPGFDEENIDERAPYPKHYLTAYQKTKSIAEQLILKANCEQLATVALRPHLIWGPGDPHLIPRILERARKGRLRLVGKRENLVDSTYIDNAAAAHLNAADRLSNKAPCAGKTYFISNDEPIPMARLMNQILAAAHLPPITKTISPRIAYFAGLVLETSYKLLGKKEEPLMTRFLARQLSYAHWYNLSAAKRDLGYYPKVSIEEGMRNLEKSLMNS